jgi:hypothetical protein
MEPQSLKYLTPRNDRSPEGEDFPTRLAALVGPGSVLEFGCGDGRLAPAFDAARYRGVDVSSHAVRVAQMTVATHRFYTMMPDAILPTVTTTFAHTVLLHVSDEDLPYVVDRLVASAPHVIVSEVMGRRWRRRGNPPVYNRESTEYVTAFTDAGMTLRSAQAWPYHRYGGVNLTVMEFT